MEQAPAEPKRDRSERLRAPAGQICLFCGNRVGGLRFEQGSEKSLVASYRVIKVTDLFDIYLNGPAVLQSENCGLSLSMAGIGGVSLPNKYTRTEAARMYLDTAGLKYLLLKNNSRK